MKHLAISGPDGSGKSFLVSVVADVFSTHIWSRHPQYFSGSFNLVMKFTGKNRRASPKKGITIGYHDYHNIFLAIPYFVLKTLDIYIYFYLKLLRLLIKKERVLFDRFVLDSVADLCVDIKRKNNIILSIFWPLVFTSRIFVEEVVLQRGNSIKKRYDVLLDENAYFREEVYLSMIEYFKCRVYLNEKWKNAEEFKDFVNC